ncbi:Rne/Rng family ribonuclease [Cytophagaceae bacterium ABcell3]|nr:Rne/Rng family ribonuclease [Cytophagaceae bacterium ABcell3]
MSNELFINSTQKGNRIALIKDKRLIECHYEDYGEKFTVGDIYLGTVKKLVPGLNAAFIDIGYEKDAFLHYLDLGPQIRSLNKYVKLTLNNQKSTQKISKFKLEGDIDKNGKISQVLSRNQQILVQVAKEPISSKGPRLSCELSIAGRYIVLVPFSNAISVSKKIVSKEERQRLARLLASIKPENFGIIIRTVAEGKDVAELDRDLRNLLQIWEKGTESLKTAKPRDKVIGEMNRASSMLRDMLNESFDCITVDSKESYEELKSLVKTIAPDKEKIVKYHGGKTKLFEAAGIEKQLKSLFGKSVSLPGGGYLIIEHTEALHVIDVNSGNKSSQESDQEQTAVSVNIEAAREIARQLRLRDMGGIIVIDFIDMKKAENKKLVYEKMQQEMKDERSKFVILPVTKFGLMQITRQRVRPEMNIITMETCPTCQGTGKISASILVSDQVESNLDYLITKQNETKISIILHPFLYAWFTKGFISKRVKWFFKYKIWVKLEMDTSLGITDFRFINNQGEEIEVI